jgi:hypothetical protein
MKSPRVKSSTFLKELVAKHALTLLLFLGLYRPLSTGPLATLEATEQGSVISLMGFLMAAAIIGAFELTYSRTDLRSTPQRHLAHGTKLMLYSSILLLMHIAVSAMRVSGEGLEGTMVMAATPIAIALVAYDFWDALRALDERPS